MKSMFKHILGTKKPSTVKNVVAGSGNGAKNLDKLRQYAESLYNFVCDSCGQISDMMKSCGLDVLTDGDGNLLPEVDNYPELKKLVFERLDKKKELQKILYTHPELWRPIEDDASMYYDEENICQQIDAVHDNDAKYIENLRQRIDKLAVKFGGHIDGATILMDKDADLGDAPTQEMADSMNEYFYLYNLYLDALATVADKQDKILWDAVPKVIKDKYVQFVNDKMVEILASDDELAYCVKNFDANQMDPDAYERFARLLERKLNSGIFKNAKRPIKIDLYFNKYAIESGLYNEMTNELKFNTANWGLANAKSLVQDINIVVGNIKHEIFGHYANSNLSELGLYGTRMKEYMLGIQSCSHASLVKAMDIRTIVVKSPWLKQHYSISMPPQKFNKKWINTVGKCFQPCFVMILICIKFVSKNVLHGF
ncbi:MAG: hypothetical protein J6Y07_02325 [Alphaproteobacteria bacterium]|nr:hypothetical protein [Alphaproteobacteria bacterium]